MPPTHTKNWTILHAHHMGTTCTPHTYHMHTTWVSHVHHMGIRWSKTQIIPLPAYIHKWGKRRKCQQHTQETEQVYSICKLATQSHKTSLLLPHLWHLQQIWVINLLHVDFPCVLSLDLGDCVRGPWGSSQLVSVYRHQHNSLLHRKIWLIMVGFHGDQMHILLYLLLPFWHVCSHKFKCSIWKNNIK